MDALTLHNALQAAGLPVIGCDSLGNVQYSRELSPSELSTAAWILAQYSEIDNPPVYWLHYDSLTPGGGAEIQTDGVPLLKNTNDDSLSIVASLRTTADSISAVIPYAPAVKWPIRIRRGDGRQMIVRVEHSEPGIFPFTLRMPGKDSGRYCIDDSDFATVTVNGVIYSIKQAKQLVFDVYEDL